MPRLTHTPSDALPFASAHKSPPRWALLCTALLGALWGATAQAQTTDPTPADRQEVRLDTRQERQDTRIDQGVASGELTRPEAMRLNREQRHINRLERRAEADGDVTRREALRLEKAQDRASRHIGHAAHDRQNRPSTSR